MQPTLNPSPYQPAPLLDSSPEGMPGCDRYVFGFNHPALSAHCNCFPEIH